MDRDSARRRLLSMTDGAADPALDAEELEELLDDHATVDADGRAPTDADWVGTFDLNRAAAAGWRRRAGKVAGDYDVNADGRSLSRSKVRESFLAMAEQYDALAAGGATTLDVSAAPPELRLAPEQVLNL